MCERTFCKISLPSSREAGFTESNIGKYICDDSAKLAYFTDRNGTSEKIAKYNGSANSNACSYIGYYLRPALILPSNLLTSDDGTVNTNTVPTTPASINVPDTIQGRSTITVSWGASTVAGNRAATGTARRQFRTVPTLRLRKSTKKLSVKSRSITAVRIMLRAAAFYFSTKKI